MPFFHCFLLSNFFKKHFLLFFFDHLFFLFLPSRGHLRFPWGGMVLCLGQDHCVGQSSCRRNCLSRRCRLRVAPVALSTFICSKRVTQIRALLRKAACCCCFGGCIMRVYGPNDMAMQRQSLRLVYTSNHLGVKLPGDPGTPEPSPPGSLRTNSGRPKLCKNFTCGISTVCFTISTPQDLLLRHNRDVDDNEKLQLRHSRFSALSVVAQRRASSTLPKNCPEESSRSSAQFAPPYLSLQNNDNVQHSVDELNLRNQDQEEDDAELLELAQHGHWDVNRNAKAAQYLCTALGWR